MRREDHFDSSWPVALVFGLIGTFTLALTPAGQQLSDEFLSLPRWMRNAGPITPSRPQVLVVTNDRQDQLIAAVAVNPRGYHILVAETASAAQEALQTYTGGIDVVLVDMRLKSAAHVLGLVRSLAPTAKLIPLRPNHSTTDISALLVGAL
jgi:CheY-like chemotaxis protein